MRVEDRLNEFVVAVVTRAYEDLELDADAEDNQRRYNGYVLARMPPLSTRTVKPCENPCSLGARDGARYRRRCQEISHRGLRDFPIDMDCRRTQTGGNTRTEQSMSASTTVEEPRSAIGLIDLIYRRRAVRAYQPNTIEERRLHAARRDTRHSAQASRRPQLDSLIRGLSILGETDANVGPLGERSRHRSPRSNAGKSSRLVSGFRLQRGAGRPTV
jgi:hypothetical protein